MSAPDTSAPAAAGAPCQAGAAALPAPDDLQVGTLTWVPALDRPDLLARPVAAALARWADAVPAVATHVVVAEIDPDAADTDVMSRTYDIPTDLSANCVLVSGRRAGEERHAAALVRATARADVNGTVKALLDVRKASFLPMDRAVAESRMEYGGITPIGLPDGWRVLVDPDVVAAGSVACVGSGVRRSKLVLAGALLRTLPGVEVTDGLALRQDGRRA
ncbi:YbaK/EbsC family protein [Luteimicrobium subarcticum]|uniref:Prolyl-tRNA editing enzyme YbaK/EbsC (Cys-tRNA(Pro) deacylase) n=1 Tax=Luteimicrobium subarcticum TaxID=620910 RepID=A0A2M8W3M4_9MICO|nr:YbaK/EbsC family protein [Luteimicrobium subarcticum]PJI85517.1 prolyl-tRNA editing enzyme YbaK/EbsC (Cys-tRNA(Pro) deacylase) [Luteimicrobium subarcticum]